MIRLEEYIKCNENDIYEGLQYMLQIINLTDCKIAMQNRANNNCVPF